MLFFTSNIFGQSGTLRGKIFDSKTNEPFVFCTVILSSLHLGTTSDLDGAYEIKNIPPGIYEFECNYIGYSKTTFTIEIVSGVVRQYDILLSEYPMNIDPPAVLPGVFGQVNIEGTRATTKTPMTYVDIDAKDIQPLNNGQDLPYLLRFTPSLIATSDAGNGVGYTSSWIRGSDPSRINVTLNGIPLNDPESQQVFWVNTPDFGSSANTIQVQRGIGTSANGSSSFGGAIKIETRGTQTKPYAETNNVFGSFNTMKNNVAFGTGLLRNHFTLEGRLSRISSDGYIDRASSDLKSFFMEASYVNKKTTIKANFFGGKEITYQSWNGTPVSVLDGNIDSIANFAERNYYSVIQTDNLVNAGRTYNYYQYKNQVDNYGQNHAQLHLSHQFNDYFRLNLSGHFTRGQGYYEEYKSDQDFSSYGLAEIFIDSNSTISSTDLVRRRYLKNNFYGTVASFIYQKGNWESVFGGAYNEYRGKHFGELTWMEFAGNSAIGDHYYDGKSLKRDGNAYWKNTFTVGKKLDLYADLQIRNVNYSTLGVDNNLRAYSVKKNLTFSNPKFGLNYRINTISNVYASIAQAGKEPNRNDFVDAVNDSLVKPEYMTDLEFGYKISGNKYNFSLNGYYMNYKDQLVLTGELNDVGAPLRTNVSSSFRRGLEFSGSYLFTPDLSLSGNVTLSQNKIKSFNESIYTYDYNIVAINHQNTDIAFSPSASVSGQLQYRIWNKSKSQFLEAAWMTKYVGKQYLDNTQNERLTIAPYLVNDLRISYHIASTEKCDLQLNAWVNNILGEVYSSNGYTYSYINVTRVTEIFYYPQAGRNYSFGISLKF